MKPLENPCPALAGLDPEVRVATAREAVIEARSRTLALTEDLTDQQLLGEFTPIANPLLWEIGHVAWFHEKWILRHAHGEAPIHTDADTLYDSSAVAHKTRWDLPLLQRQFVLDYLATVRDRVLSKLDQTPVTDELLYFVLLSIFHEDMHTEAFTCTRQSQHLPRPSFFPELGQFGELESADRRLGDSQIPGGTFLLGSCPEIPFAFDNEKWEHPVSVDPFAIARAAVTEAEFLEFVVDGGYRIAEFWDDEGWQWRSENRVEHPVYWRQESTDTWRRRDFEDWVPISDQRAIINVNWHEASAFCRYKKRRLPTEIEWEVAASCCGSTNGDLGETKRTFPWGDAPPLRDHANVDWVRGGCAGVHELGDGDSFFGCRQMMGNAWEWTETAFHPYPEFSPDAYEDYSRPWFGDHKVARGGSFATRARLLRNTLRNFYLPHRRDIWIGFRTCAI